MNSSTEYECRSCVTRVSLHKSTSRAQDLLFYGDTLGSVELGGKRTSGPVAAQMHWQWHALFRYTLTIPPTVPLRSWLKGGWGGRRLHQVSTSLIFRVLFSLLLMVEPPEFYNNLRQTSCTVSVAAHLPSECRDVSCNKGV